MNIKETLKHIWFGTKMLASVVGAMALGVVLALYAPWLLFGIGILWLVWFIGYMLS